MKEWKRVVKPGGLLLLFLPNKACNFDRRRDFTTFEHLMSDYEKGTPETDMTHLDEILEKHDYTLDAHSGGPEKFRARAMDNFTNRCLHHHVFNLDLLQEDLRLR